MAFKFSVSEQRRREAVFRSILRKRKSFGQTYENAAAGSGYSVSTLKRWARLLGLDDHPVSK